MKLALALLLLVAACDEKKNPWAIDWTREQRKAWPLGCPGTALTEEEGPDAAGSVSAERVGDDNGLLPITCYVLVRNGNVTAIAAVLKHNPLVPGQRSPEIAVLLDHVLATLPKRHRDAVRAVAQSEVPTEHHVGKLYISGGHDRSYWRIRVEFLP